MSSSKMRLLVAAWLLVGLAVIGCAKDNGADSTSGTTPPPSQTETDEAAEIEAELAKLSAEDRALADKQKICPVSEEPLGSMGTPIKVSVADRVVFICCEGCDETLKADPDKYLANLKQQ